MFSTNMRAIYNRLAILGLLSACLLVFSYNGTVETAWAAAGPCQQDCDRYHEMCMDNCQDECGEGSTDAICNSCISNCFTEWNDCSAHSIWCSSGTITYSPECQVQFGVHCIDFGGGVESCLPQDGAHNGYSQLCNRIGYENGCINCPNPGDPNENCYDGNSPGDIPQCL